MPRADERDDEPDAERNDEPDDERDDEPDDGSGRCDRSRPADEPDRFCAERVDIVIEGAITMRPHYRVVVRRMGWVVAGTLLVVVGGAIIVGRWT